MSDCGHGKKKLLVNRCCWLWVSNTSFRLVLVHIETLRISVQLKDLNMFFIAMKIHTMVRIVKKQNNFIFNSLVT